MVLETGNVIKLTYEKKGVELTFGQQALSLTAGYGVSVIGGDVYGGSSSTDNAVARFNGITGKVIQNSLVTIDDNGSVNIPTGQAYKINGTALAYTDITNAIALTSLSSTATGLTYTNTTGAFSLTSGYIIPTTTEQTNWGTAYTNTHTHSNKTTLDAIQEALTTALKSNYDTAYGWGNHASAGYQAGSSNLTSVSGLTFASASFVKMTGANTFALDTNTYLTSLTGAVLTDQSTPQTIGATGARLAMLWATDITCTNAISGSVTGNAGTVTNATLTTALTVNTGTLTLTANNANTSVLTIGAGAVSVSGSNTGDQTKIANLIGGNNTTLLGSIPYQSDTDVTTLLAPNTTTTKKFLRGTGDGTNGTAPAWDTVTSTDVGLGSVENTALSTWTGSSNLYTVKLDGSTLTSTSSGLKVTDSTFQGLNSNLTSVAGLTYVSGSFVKMTGANTFTLDTSTYMANPMTTAGDIIIGGVSGAPARLGVGTDTYVLTMVSGAPAWAVGGAGGGASTALDNLASVAINTTLVSDTDNTDALGTVTKAWSDLFLGTGGVITFTSAPDTADVTLTHSANLLTLSGGDLALGANNLTMTGSIADTTNRATKGWFTNLEITNLPTVNGGTLATALSLSNYAPLASPTFTTSINGSYLTASEILITDGSKNIVSAPVATYPSLTELSYVKGLSSAIQTQLGNKAPTANPTFTGTVVLPKTLEIQDTSADHQYVLAVNELTADRTVTLPLLTGNDEFVFKDFTQTFTNKTLSTGSAVSELTMSLGSDADGDIYYRSSNKLTRLAKGTASQVLAMNSGATAPEWTTSSGGGGSLMGTSASGFTTGSTDYVDATGYTVNVEANSTYTFLASMSINADNDSDGLLKFVYPTGTTAQFVTIYKDGSSAMTISYASQTFYWTATNHGQVTINISGKVVTSSTAGAFKIQIKSSLGDNITLAADSQFSLIKTQ